MPTLPASWNAQTRLAIKHALVGAVVVCLLLVFIEQKQWPISGLLVSLLILAAVYLLLVAVPFTLGRALKTFERLPACVPTILYVGWGGALAWFLADSSFDVLARCAVSLPRYLDMHGFFTVSALVACVVSYLIVARTPVRIEDAFSLAPSAAFVLAMVLDGYLYRQVPIGNALDMLTAEAHHGATAFLATFIAVTLGGWVAWRAAK